MAEPTSPPEPRFSIHIPQKVAGVAEGDDNMDSLFPHTPRHDQTWYEAEPAAELIEQCLRPGHCALDEGDMRDWLHKRLATLGHAANDAGSTLMAQTWFECSYAAKGEVTALLSSTNMRFKLGQWSLAQQLYTNILSMELTEPQREAAQRKLGEVADKAASRAVPPKLEPADELQALLSAQGVPSGALKEVEAERVLQLLRTCGFAANKAGDFEAAQNWFDGAFAVSAATCDLLSAANMRHKLLRGSPVAAAVYRHVLTREGVSETETSMAQAKLAAVELAAGDAQLKAIKSMSAAEDAQITYRANAF